MDNLEKETWFPTPRYICRKSIVLDFLSEIKKGKVLEVGMGAGDLVKSLADRGYEGLGIEISREALEIARKRLAGVDKRIRMEKKDLFDICECFEIVIMLEVIEHIENDDEALKKLYDIINDGGYLIISAPVHKKEWSFESDVLAGHFRRYEKDEMKRKLEKSGFEVLKMFSYGFPITNFARPIRNYLMRKDNLSGKFKKMNTERSGTDRNSQKKFSFLINKYTMAPFLYIQKFFFSKDLSDGCVVLARKKGNI